MEDKLIVKCPTCKVELEWRRDSVFRPFCSERCKIMDTAAWADGSYTLSRELTQDDEELMLKALTPNANPS